LVLASDEDGGSLEALRFSLASDIIELVVLTADDAFLQTLREAVGAARRLWHVPSADKVSDLLVAGEVGIVVLDVQALNEAATVFVSQIKRQFPDLVVVVAGLRDDENSLAGLISAGIVYRFIHKPVSPARAKLFAEAAIKKHDDQRRRAAETPPTNRSTGLTGGWLIGGTIAVLALIAVATWLMHRNAAEDTGPAQTEAAKPSAQSQLLARADAALSANRLTEPAGDNALELYQQVQAHSPAEAAARAAGVAEVHERLLARAENALLEERLDEAAAAIETARKSGVESGRIAFLTAQLAKLRDQVKTAQAKAQVQAQAQLAAQAQVQAREGGDGKPDGDRVTPLLNLAGQRIDDGRLLGSDRDNARFYVQEALRIDPENAAAQESKRVLASRLLTEARSAIDRRDFARAVSFIEGAEGIAVAANIEAAQGLLDNARKQADADAWTALLKNANDRIQQDRLIEPANDNAKYFVLTLRRLDPANAGLPAAIQDLGTRITAKARRALALEQYDAARSWLDEAAEIGFSSSESASVQHDLDAAVAKQKLLEDVVPASQLTLLKTVQPVYPPRAVLSRTDGWVELSFTVSETGQVRNVAVLAVSAAGIFEDAAVKALSQWRYKPILRDGKPVAVRTQIRIRFTLS
jgi:TonB family protein